MLLLKICVFTLLVCQGFSAVVPDRAVKPEWKGKEAEIYFLLDSSSSVWKIDYERMEEFVATLVSAMDIRPSATRVGVGSFAVKHRMHLPINNALDKDGLMTSIMDTPYLSGNTLLSGAIQGARKEGLAPKYVRSKVPLIAVLLTDGSARFQQLLMDNATLAKEEGIYLFTIGIGSDVNADELRSIASDPKTDFAFSVPDFDSLFILKDRILDIMADVAYLQADAGSCSQTTRVDTVFVFDQSAIGTNATSYVQKMLEHVAEKFDMDSGNVRIGVVSKTCHQGEITLGQYVSTKDFIAGLDLTKGPGIGDLLKQARLNSFWTDKGARLQAKRRIVLILTELSDRNIENVKAELLRAKYVDNFEVFIVYVGGNYQKKLLGQLATSQSTVTYVDTFQDLIKPVQFTMQFCKDL